MQLLAQTTAAITALSRKAASSDLSLLSGGGAEAGSGSLTGATGAAAMEVQRMELHDRPSSVTDTIRANMAKASGTDPNSPQDAFLFFEKNGRFADHMKEGAFMSMILAQIWNQLETGQVEAAHASTAVAMCAIDQWGISQNLEFGYLWTHLSDPPFSHMSRNSRTRDLRPFSKLVPPRWVAASAAYLRDMDSLADRIQPRRQYPPGGDKGDPKGKGKSKKEKVKAKAAAEE